MKCADTHCHILKQYYENPQFELQTLEEEGYLEYVQVMGIEPNSNQELIDLKKKFHSHFLRIGIGLHPSNVIEAGDDYALLLTKVLEQINTFRSEIDYIGEIGIDYTYQNSLECKTSQIEVFKVLCTVAKELYKPLSIHCRESWSDVMMVIDTVGFMSDSFNGYLHSFTGDFDQGRFFVDRGFKLGLNGIVTFKRSEELRTTIKKLLNHFKDKSFDDIFGLETDSPYLAPEPIRSEKNHPQNIVLIKEYLEKIQIF